MAWVAATQSFSQPSTSFIDFWAWLHTDSSNDTGVLLPIPPAALTSHLHRLTEQSLAACSFCTVIHKRNKRNSDESKAVCFLHWQQKIPTKGTFYLSQCPESNRRPTPSFTPQFIKRDIWGLDCILRIPIQVKRPLSVVRALNYECHGLGHTLAINRYSGFVYKVSFVSGRGLMTHHGVALPAELHWLHFDLNRWCDSVLARIPEIR